MQNWPCPVKFGIESAMIDRAHVYVRRWEPKGINTRVFLDPVDVFFCFSPTVFTYLPGAEQKISLTLQK